MDIKEILNRSDILFQNGRSEEVAGWLKENAVKARDSDDWGTELSLLNELMGYYRSISRLETAWEYAFRAMEIMNRQGLENTAEGMTTCLNVANVYRASGKTGEAVKMYLRVEQVYQKLGMEKDYRLGGLFNNMSVAYLELGKSEEAVGYGEKAIRILRQVPGAEDECATVYGNLAGVMLNSDRPDLEKADEYIDSAMHLFEEICKNSPHYPGALAMKAYITFLKKDLQGALILYEKAMEETEKHYGKNADYERLRKNYEKIKEIADR